MIYVCIPCRNEAQTVGVLLWKIRQVFTAHPREYHLLVADDASTDASAEVLEQYTKVLPLTVVRQERHQGYAKTVERLCRLHADFLHDPTTIPDLVRRLESGADLVVAESRGEQAPTRGHRLLRRFAPLLMRRRIRVPGVRDTVSGFLAFRLSTLRDVFRERAPVLTGAGWAANAELIGRAAATARRVDVVPTAERYDLLQRPTHVDPWPAARELWRAAGRLKLPPKPARPALRETEPVA
jgi:glycosyltransferase involved in cell wall biosynthesis